MRAPRRCARAATALGVAASGDERLEQQRALGVVVIASSILRRRDEVGADGAQDVGGVALELVLGEQVVELVGGAGLDRGLEQVGLAGETAVDGAGGQAGPAGDLLHSGPVVALLGEHGGGGVEESIAGRITRLGDCHRFGR